MENKIIIRMISIFLLMCFSISTYAYAEPGWVGEKIQVIGQGMVDTNKYSSLGQAKLMAKRAATLDAKHNLLKQVLDLRVKSETTIRDIVPESDRTNIYLSGIIRDADALWPAYDDSGICTVKVESKLSDVYSYLKEKNLL